MRKSAQITRFGEELKKILDDRGMTQTQLEKEVGLSRNMISRYVVGETTPSKRTVGRIEKTLSLEPGSLFCLVDAVKQQRETCYAPSKKETAILRAWNRGEKTPYQVSLITGYSMREVGKYLPLGIEKELPVLTKK